MLYHPVLFFLSHYPSRSPKPQKQNRQKKGFSSHGRIVIVHVPRGRRRFPPESEWVRAPPRKKIAHKNEWKTKITRKIDNKKAFPQVTRCWRTSSAKTLFPCKWGRTNIIIMKTAREKTSWSFVVATACVRFSIGMYPGVPVIFGLTSPSTAKNIPKVTQATQR